MLVSVIIPAYKQEATIKNNVRDIYAAMSRTRWNFEIIVVVDGFADRTFEEASKIIEENVYVIGYEQNQGKGYAVKFGMTQARGDLVAFIDAGMDINSNSISMLLEHMEWYKADIVVGSKRHPASKVQYPLLRKVYSWGYYTLARVLFGLKISDIQTGLKIYKREVLQEVLPRLLIKEFAFDIEMLAVAKKLGYKRIFEGPVELALSFEDTSFSKLLIFDPFIQKMLWDTLAVFYRLRILRYYDDGNSHKWMQHDIAQLISASTKMSKIRTPEFSIIIPVRQMNAFMFENLEYLEKLSYPYFEVIVVFDYLEGSDDYGWNEQYRCVAVGPKSPGEKRNIGASMADGNILVFLDDDAFPEEDWLTHAAEIFTDSDVYALGGPAITPKNVGIMERLPGRLLETPLVSGPTLFRHVPSEARPISDHPSVNLFVRKDAFLEVGGFISEFWPGEDTKLCLDLVNKFRRPFLYDPRPLVYHHRRDGLLPHLKQYSRYGRHRGQFAKIFPQTSRLLGYFVPMLFVLGLVIGPIISIIFPVLWTVYFSVVGLYLFLVLKRSLRVFIDELNPFAGVFIFVGIFLTHVVYGINFVIGLIKRPKLELKTFDVETGDYVGG